MSYSYIPGVDAETVPPEVERVLTNMFGWTKSYPSVTGIILFTKAAYPGYYSWSEAMVLELSRTFVELGKT